MPILDADVFLDGVPDLFQSGYQLLTIVLNGWVVSINTECPLFFERQQSRQQVVPY